MRSLAERARTPRALVLGLAAGAVLVACQDHPAAANNNNHLPPDAAAAPAATDPVVLEGMEEAIEDEYRAEATYAAVMETFGEIRPFSSIVEAETRHWEALAHLFERRGLPVPPNEWTTADIPVFGSVAEACQAGVAAEIANAAIYDRYLGLELPADVRRVFQTNRDASMDNHLPAFQRCS